MGIYYCRGRFIIDRLVKKDQIRDLYYSKCRLGVKGERSIFFWSEKSFLRTQVKKEKEKESVLFLGRSNYFILGVQKDKM